MALTGSVRSAIRPARRVRPVLAAVPWVFAAATVAVQITYPLVDGESLRRVTLASVVLFFLASTSHAAVHRGVAWALGFVAVTVGGGLLAEAVGVRTGVPFGDYAYDRSLGAQLLGVPLLVPLAWSMMAYPVFLAARHVTRRWVAPVGGVGLAAWDVFLDPQMVADGRWRWSDPTPSLPGIDQVPISNYVGWLVVATLMMAVLDAALPRVRADDRQPAALLFWTWAGSVVGNLLWFGSPAVALAGGLAMGLLTVPYAWSLWSSRP